MQDDPHVLVDHADRITPPPIQREAVEAEIRKAATATTGTWETSGEHLVGYEAAGAEIDRGWSIRLREVRGAPSEILSTYELPQEDLCHSVTSMGLPEDTPAVGVVTEQVTDEVTEQGYTLPSTSPTSSSSSKAPAPPSMTRSCGAPSPRFFGAAASPSWSGSAPGPLTHDRAVPERGRAAEA